MSSDPERPDPKRVETAKATRRWGFAVWGGLGALLIPLGVMLVPRAPEAAPAAVPDTPEFDGKALKFSKGFAERAGIRVEAVTRGAMTPVVKVVGAVTFNPAKMAAAGARTKGFVRKVTKVEGDEVKVGEVLAEIESAELGQAQAEIAVARARRRIAEVSAARENELLKKQLTTLREAEDAELQLAERKAALTAANQRVTALGGAAGPFGVYLVKAPIDGHIVERRVDVGQTVESDVVAFRVADLSTLWVELDVFERNIGAVQVGDKVEVRPLSDTAVVIEGKVAHVEQVLDVATRSASVRVNVDNRDGKLRPGQSVQASIHATGPTREALSVPDVAVTYVDGRPTVFVADGPDRVIPVVVKLGASDGVRQEILEGVAAGQQVVVDGVFALKSELFR
jgi:cobalt-zinc-cadmium efflux system membrane fusion protein